MGDFNELFGRIISDFDHKSGHFTGLNYSSPYTLVQPVIADRSGYSVESIREAITQERICRATSRKLDEKNRNIYDTWISTYKAYLIEIDFFNPPSNYYQNVSKFSNTKFLRKYCKSMFEKIGCYEINIENNSQVMEFNGYLQHNAEISLAIRFEIVKKYGGVMRASVVFRRHEPGKPGAIYSSVLDVNANMMGALIFFDLRINNPPEEFRPIAEHDGTDVPSVEKVLSIIERVTLYYFDSN